MYKLLAVTALLVSVALAQPYINGGVLSRYNYIQPPTSMSQVAVTGVAQGHGWIFTATSDGIYGMNSTQPSYDASNVQFFDALPGVTQIFETGEWTLIAIANSSIVLYQFNWTAAWRQAIYKRDDLSFDVKQYNNGGSSGTSYLYPLVFGSAWGSQLVIGSQNQFYNSGANSWSQVFSFNATTLELLWNTTIPRDTTSFAPASYYGDQFVFIQAQDRNGGYSNVHVYKMWLNNGTIIGTALNTGDTDFTSIGVSSTQLVVSSRDYITIYDANTWAMLGTQVSTTRYAYNVLYQPIPVNGTWYVLMDQQLYAFDYATSAQLSWSPKTFSNSVLGATMRFINESMTTGMFQSNLLMMEGCNVWVVNTSGVIKMKEWTQLAQGATTCNPVAAHFDHAWRNMPEAINNIVHLSYQSSYGGTIISLDYSNGWILAQATGNFNPIGVPMINFHERRLYSASTTGGIVQGFAFNPRMSSNYTDFVAAIPSNEDTTSRFGFAYNASNKSSYYITEDNLYLVDYMGNVEKVAAIANDAYYVYNNPLIVGKYFVFLASWGSTYIYVYDSVAKTIVNTQWCSPSDDYPIFNVGTIVYSNCDSSSRAVASVDVSKAALTITSFGDYYGYGVSADAKNIAYAQSSKLYVYDLTQSPAKKRWETSSMTLYSAPVLYGDNVFVVGRLYTTTDTAQYLLKIAVSSGSITKVGKVYSTQYTVVIKQQGLFGSGGFVYCIGTSNVTAFNMGDNTQAFTYAINSTKYGSIVLNMMTPAVLDNGAVAFYTSNNYLQVVGGFKGGLAWSYAGASTTYFPFMSDSKSVYFVRNNQVVGADTYTGAVTSVTSFGSQTLFGYAIDAGINETTVIGANGFVVFAATTPVYTSPAGTNPSFPGSGSSGSGGGLLEEAKSKAWIAGVVIGVLVVIVIVVIIAKKKSAPASGDDYVAMNPATQV